VRTGEGKYLGTLESTQDVTELRALQSERRIYSEEQGGRYGKKARNFGGIKKCV